MKIKHTYSKPWLMETPDENGGSGEESSPLDVLDADLPRDEEEETPNEETPDGEEQGEKTAPGGIDYEKLAQTFSGALAQHVKAGGQPKQEEEKQLTPEEARKLLNFWEPDDDFVTKLQNVETTKEALAMLRDGMTKQVMTMVNALVHERLGGVDSKYAPLLTAHEERQASERQGRFHKEYPALADKNLQPVVAAVINSLTQSGQKFSSEKESFTAIAKGVEAVVKQVNPNFKLTGGAAPTNKKPGNPNALRSVKSGTGKAGAVPTGEEGKGKPLALKYL